MIPRGLAAAVLATYPITMGIPNAETYPQVVFFIILSSVIITTIGLAKSKKIPPLNLLKMDLLNQMKILENRLQI